MTLDEAKVLIIDRMNYIAYREYGVSFYPSDRNRFLGSDHYRLEPHTYLPDTPSRWSPGQDLHSKLPEVLAFAWQYSEKTKFKTAIQLARESQGALAALIVRAEQEQPLADWTR